MVEIIITNETRVPKLPRLKPRAKFETWQLYSKYLKRRLIKYPWDLQASEEQRLLYILIHYRMPKGTDTWERYKTGEPMKP